MSDDESGKKKYAFLVRMKLEVDVPEGLSDKDAAKRVKALVNELLDGRTEPTGMIPQAERDRFSTGDDEDDEDEETDDACLYIVGIMGNPKVVLKGRTFSEKEITRYLLKNPGYSTCRTATGVRFTPFSSSKTYDAASLTEAVSDYLADEEQKATAQALTQPKKLYPKKKRPVKIIRYEDEE
jgi:hypothetical protein